MKIHLLPLILLDRLDEWQQEGLISLDQADAIRRRESTLPEPRPRRHVTWSEIFVYLGSLIVFLALVLLTILNWSLLGSAGRILIVLTTTVVMLLSGWWLLGAFDFRLRRGTQALWLAGALLCGLSAAVLFTELGWIAWGDQGPGAPLVVVSCLIALSAAGLLFYWLPTVTQSVILHACGTAALFTFLLWLVQTWPIANTFYDSLRLLLVAVVIGTGWLLLGLLLDRRQASPGLVRVSRVFGVLTILLAALIAAVQSYPVVWQEVTMEAALLAACLGFIIASVKRQSRTYLFAGVTFLLFLITYVNLAHFADRIGVPLALFVTGIILLALGLGAGRLNKHIRSQ